MLLNNLLELFDGDPDNFKQYVCDINCPKSLYFCKNTDTVKKYKCYTINGS